MDTFTPVTTPPFCPNPDCPHHRDPTGWRPVRDGTHARKHPPLTVQRFKCLRCKRSFSTQTYALGYWMRRQDLFVPVFQALASCACLRQIARQLFLTRVQVSFRVERLARHCLLLNETLRPKGPLTEAVVLDGFESFEYSQFAPMHLNLLVGARSLFVHAFTESELRRKGRMTQRQKKRRVELEESHGRPDPDAIRKGVEQLLRLALPKAGPIVLQSDDHRAYPRAIAGLPPVMRNRVTHRITPSTVARNAQNPLFSVNLTDLLLRHCGANHKRETIAFSKRRQCIVDRASIFTTWRNLVKSRSENAKDDPPGVSMGLVPFRPTVSQILARRLFATHVELPAPLEIYYQRRVMTRYLLRQRVHALKYAY